MALITINVPNTNSGRFLYAVSDKKDYRTLQPSDWKDSNKIYTSLTGVIYCFAKDKNTGKVRLKTHYDVCNNDSCFVLIDKIIRKSYGCSVKINSITRIGNVQAKKVTCVIGIIDITNPTYEQIETSFLNIGAQIRSDVWIDSNSLFVNGSFVYTSSAKTQKISANRNYGIVIDGKSYVFSTNQNSSVINLKLVNSNFDWENIELPKIIEANPDVQINYLGLNRFIGLPYTNKITKEFVVGVLPEYLDNKGTQLTNIGIVGLSNNRLYSNYELAQEYRYYWGIFQPSLPSNNPTIWSTEGYNEATNMVNNNVSDKLGVKIKCNHYMIDSEDGPILQSVNYIPYIQGMYGRLKELNPTAKLYVYGIYPKKAYNNWDVSSLGTIYPNTLASQATDRKRLDDLLSANADWFYARKGNIFFNVEMYAMVQMPLFEFYQKNGNEYIVDENGKRLYGNVSQTQTVRGYNYQFQDKCATPVNCPTDAEGQTYRTYVPEVHLGIWQPYLFLEKHVDFAIAFMRASGQNTDNISNYFQYSKFSTCCIMRTTTAGNSWNTAGLPIDRVTCQYMAAIAFTFADVVSLWDSIFSGIGLKSEGDNGYLEATNEGTGLKIVPASSQQVNYHNGLFFQSFGMFIDEKISNRDYGLNSIYDEILCFTHEAHKISKQPAWAIGKIRRFYNKTAYKIYIGYPFLGLNEPKTILLKNTVNSESIAITLTGREDFQIIEGFFSAELLTNQIYLEYVPLVGNQAIKPTGDITVRL